MQPLQTELNFQGNSQGGFDAWRAQQQKIREELARNLGLPLGKPVEVWLRGGVRLRGELQLKEAMLIEAQSTLQNTRFEVTGVPFSYDEIESCVRM